jgi:hypothetical protein
MMTNMGLTQLERDKAANDHHQMVVPFLPVVLRNKD